MAFLIWIFFQITVFIIQGLCFSVFLPLNYITKSIMVYATQGISFLAFITLFKRYLSGTHIKKHFRLNEWKLYLSCLLIGVGICMSHKLIFMIFPQIGLGLFQQIGSETYYAAQNSMRNPVIFISACFILPILEELFFRGILYNSLARHHGPVYTIIFSAVIFGVSHMNLVQFISATYMGLFIGYVISITKDLRLGMLIHIANNTYSLVLGYFMKSDYIPYYVVACSIIIGYVVLVFGLVLLKRGKHG